MRLTLLEDLAILLVFQVISTLDQCWRCFNGDVIRERLEGLGKRGRFSRVRRLSA